jgi:glycosyltransferase involved in cell wall biosynthesis
MSIQDVSVVMPCLNEVETIEGCIVECQCTFASARLNGEVVIGDNGSTDGSQELSRSLGARVISVTCRGYGAAIMAGIEACQAEFVVMGDSDGSYDFRQIPVFLSGLSEGNDLVIGDRFSGSIEAGAMPWLNRYIGNPLLTKIGRILFRSDVRDFHCGIRAFRRDAILGLGLKSPGMEFASEMIAKSVLARLRIGQVPATLRKDGRSRAPHLRPWRDGWRHLRYMLNERMIHSRTMPCAQVKSTPPIVDKKRNGNERSAVL